MSETIVRKSPRWMKILLVLSLAINLLIVGAVGAKFYHHRGGGYGAGLAGGFAGGQYGTLSHPAAMHHASRHLMWKLPREKRRELFDIIRTQRKSLKPQFEALAVSRREFAQLIQKPYEQSAYDTAFAKIDAAQTALQSRASGLIKSVIAVLTPEQKAMYGKIMLDPPRKRWFKRGKHSGN